MATVHLLSKPLSDEEASRWVDKGLPWGEAEFLAKELKIDLSKLAVLAGISESTFFRRRAQKRFTPAESDHIMRFARLWNLAVRVIADEEGAREWLKSDEIGLKGRILSRLRRPKPAPGRSRRCSRGSSSASSREGLADRAEPAHSDGDDGGGRAHPGRPLEFAAAAHGVRQHPSLALSP